MGQVAVGAAREAHDHGIVAFFDAFQRNGQVLLGLQGYVVGAVSCRFTVGIGIDAEHREVASVARPHPVVGFAAELADGGRRSRHHAHVVIHLQVNQVEFVAGIERQCLGQDARFAVQVAVLQRFVGKVLQERSRKGLFFLHLAFLHLGVDGIGHVDDAFHELELQARSGKFFAAVLGPEAVGQVIVFHRAMLLDGIVAAVVVGQDEAVGRDDFTGTATAEDTHGILQRNAVGTIQIFSLQQESLCLHAVGQVLFLHQLQQPHPFVCLRGQESQAQQCQGNQFHSFHVYSVKGYFLLFIISRQK
ncbi:hypothetical protein EVA_07763 [gut metagenome]|uniref:Uncharacterized protein n=1 Tax=gut metagenome TaxID=749906 RepID=J9GUL1_9ZZZZ